LIMPSSVPIDDADVKNELLRYLDNQWEPIISQDVDGPDSTPARLDSENPNFGRVSACKRVARSLYIGTAPDAETERPGIGDQRVKLACVMPGEPIATFGDALRRLGDRGRFIQQDGDRYWIDTRPNLNRTAEDYRESYLRQRQELNAELNTRLAKEASSRGEFAGLHAAPVDGSAVPDEPSTRLVLLAAEHTHRKGVEFSAARQWVTACLQSKGNSPRQYANTLVFLAPDEDAIENLFQALADRRAWQRITDNALELNLSVAQKEQAIKKVEEATTAVASRIPETWCHLLIPYQQAPGPNGAHWDEKKLSSGKGSFGLRCSEKCEQEDLLFRSLGARRLRDDLNRFLWVEKPHVRVRDLVDWCRKYLYLPRVSSDQVILDALINSAAALSGESTFHLADSFDEASGRYSGLRAQQASSTQPSSLTGYIVKDEVALAQIEADQLASQRAKEQAGSAAPSISTTGYNPSTVSDATPGVARQGFTSGGSTATDTPAAVSEPPKPQLPSRYVASVKLDPSRASLQMSAFVEEVMSHLQALPGAQIEMTLEVQVNAPGGIDEQTARIVLENSAALKIDKPGLY
jgi:hypothetical protein